MCLGLSCSVLKGFLRAKENVTSFHGKSYKKSYKNPTNAKKTLSSERTIIKNGKLWEHLSRHQNERRRIRARKGQVGFGCSTDRKEVSIVLAEVRQF